MEEQAIQVVTVVVKRRFNRQIHAADSLCFPTWFLIGVLSEHILS